MFKIPCLYSHSLIESRTISETGINKTLLLKDILKQADKSVINLIV